MKFYYKWIVADLKNEKRNNLSVDNNLTKEYY